MIIGIMMILASLYAFVNAVSSDPPLVHWLVAGPIFMVVGIIILLLERKRRRRNDRID
jgi:membrane protein implicated in regulation of membrane protease activity